MSCIIAATLSTAQLFMYTPAFPCSGPILHIFWIFMTSSLTAAVRACIEWIELPSSVLNSLVFASTPRARHRGVVRFRTSSASSCSLWLPKKFPRRFFLGLFPTLLRFSFMLPFPPKFSSPSSSSLSFPNPASSCWCKNFSTSFTLLLLPSPIPSSSSKSLKSDSLSSKCCCMSRISSLSLLLAAISSGRGSLGILFTKVDLEVTEGKAKTGIIPTLGTPGAPGAPVVIPAPTSKAPLPSVVRMGKVLKPDVWLLFIFLFFVFEFLEPWEFTLPSLFLRECPSVLSSSEERSMPNDFANLSIDMVISSSSSSLSPPRSFLF
mmetsp:Transcript_14439/g.29691  ORF Transcript_14439/g.29691 Transcript_14439/m.29691 type:complete len:321 (-) Transcript_14439:406-1368(-)